MISCCTHCQRQCWLRLGFSSASTIILLLGLLPGDDGDYDDHVGDDGDDDDDNDDGDDDDDNDDGDDDKIN